MSDAENRTRHIKRFVMMAASFLRGGLRMTAGSTGSTPKDWDGGPIGTVLVRCERRLCVQRTVHKDVDKQNLHGVQWIAQAQECAASDERQLLGDISTRWTDGRYEEDILQPQPYSVGNR